MVRAVSETRMKKIFQLQTAAENVGMDRLANPLLKYLAIEKDQQIEQTINELLAVGIMRRTLNSLKLGRRPNPTDAWGECEIGLIPDTGIRFGLRDKELSSSLFIAGITGSGKTTTTLRFLYEWLLQEKAAIVFDWKGDYINLLRTVENMPAKLNHLWIFTAGRDRFAFNPLRPPESVETLTWIETFTDMFIHAFGLRTPSASILVTCLKELYEETEGHPTLLELREKISEYKPLSNFDKESKRSILTRLRLLTEGTLSQVFYTRTGVKLEDMMNRFVIYDLSRIPLLENKQFIIEVIYAMTYEYLKAKNDRTKTKGLFVVEEAHNVFGPKTNYDRDIMTKPEIALCEMRDYGWGTAVIDQQPSKLSSEVIANTATKICHQLVRKEDREVMANAMDLDERQSEHIGVMGKGEVFAKFNREDFPHAFHARIEPIVFTGEVGRERVKEHMRSFFQTYPIDLIPEEPDESKPIESPPAERPPEIEPEKIFKNRAWLNSVRAKVKDLDDNRKRTIILLGQGSACKSSDFKEQMKLSGGDFRQCAIDLAKSGLIGYQKPRAIGNPVLYFLRPEGLAAFHLLTNKWPYELRTQNLKKRHRHSEMKEKVIRSFTRAGWKLTKNKVEQGYVDLSLTKDSLTILVEISTGSNKYQQIYQNISKCIQSFGGVYFVCENIIAYNTVLQQTSKVAFDYNVKFILYIILYEDFLEGRKFEKYEF